MTEEQYAAHQARIGPSRAERQQGHGVVTPAPSKPLTGRFVLPWPPTGLSPNARLHWAALSKLKKRYREACRLQVLAQGAQPMEADRLDVKFTFFPPSRRRIDIDNCIARMKSGIDGVSDALGVDDSRWSMNFELSDQIGGLIRIEVRAIE
jgi:crossover junction endodeoxyribonuclease RusA